MWDGSNWQLLTEDYGPVPDCTGAPTITSISGFTGAYSLNVEFTVTCNATTSGATLYNWTVPAGLTVISGNGTKTIRLKAATAGAYTGNTIKCTVANACGSAASTAASNVTVNNCTAAPATPGAVSLSETVIVLGGSFTASVGAVTGAAEYVWTLPSGLSGNSSTRTVQITGNSSATYAAGTIKVAARNACGTSGSAGAPALTVVATRGLLYVEVALRQVCDASCPKGFTRAAWADVPTSMLPLLDKSLQYWELSDPSSSYKRRWQNDAWTRGGSMLEKTYILCY